MSPPAVRGSDTSTAAAAGIARIAPSLRSRIFAELQARGAHGATCDELEVIFGMRHQTAGARIRELVLEERVKDSERRRLTRSGRKAVVWVTTQPGLRIILIHVHLHVSFGARAPKRGDKHGRFTAGLGQVGIGAGSVRAAAAAHRR